MVSFERQVLENIRQYKLFNNRDRVLLAVSGGADSVALLHLLSAWQAELKLTLGVIHMNHGLRGEESDIDASFVENLCQQLEVPCKICCLDVKKEHQKRTGLSIQSLARELRYQVLTQVAKENGFTKVALGHTSDDQAETVLMWMLRGAGSAGLSGIPPFRPPYFIRPLLRSSRGEVETYLKQNQWSYRVDSSNANLKYQRNRIRHKLIPVLKQFNPKLIQVLSRQANILRDESEYLDSLAKTALESIVLKAETGRRVLNQNNLVRLPRSLQRRVVMLVFRQVTCAEVHPRFDFVESMLDLVYRGESGWTIQGHGVKVFQEYKEVHMLAIEEESNSFLAPIPLSVPGSIYWPLNACTIESRIVKDIPKSWRDDLTCVYLDANQFTHNLLVRQWKRGDAFCPFGMNGRKKKIQDFFSDIKLSRRMRLQVPLVVAPEGIVWVAGFRMDHRFRLMNGTERVMALKLGPEHKLSLVT